MYEPKPCEVCGLDEGQDHTPCIEVKELRARNAELEAEVARLRKALEATREYMMGGKWIYDKSPDEFIKAALEASDG